MNWPYFLNIRIVFRNKVLHLAIEAFSPSSSHVAVEAFPCIFIVQWSSFIFQCIFLCIVMSFRECDHVNRLQRSCIILYLMLSISNQGKRMFIFVSMLILSHVYRPPDGMGTPSTIIVLSSSLCHWSTHQNPNEQIFLIRGTFYIYQKVVQIISNWLKPKIVDKPQLGLYGPYYRYIWYPQIQYFLYVYEKPLIYYCFTLTIDQSLY